MEQERELQIQSEQNMLAAMEADKKNRIQSEQNMLAAFQFQQQQQKLSQQMSQASMQMQQMNSMNPMLFQQQMIYSMQYRQPTYNPNRPNLHNKQPHFNQRPTNKKLDESQDVEIT